MVLSIVLKKIGPKIKKKLGINTKLGLVERASTLPKKCIEFDFVYLS